jgi:hypothetical protein
MSIQLTATGIQFSDSTTQTTSKTGSSDLGQLLAVSTYNTGSYTWTPAQPNPTPQTATWNQLGNGITVTGSNPYSMSPNSSPTSWTQSVYTSESGTNVCATTKVNGTGNYIMWGLTRTPGVSYSAIEYALYWSTGGLVVYESGTYIGTWGTYADGWTGRVTYDGSYIRYYADQSGTRPFRVVAVSGLTGLKMQVSFYNGGSLSNVSFGPNTNIQGTKSQVKLVGAGGGAAGYCESGGAGGYSEIIIDSSAVTSVAVTVGSGGGAVGYYAAAGAGGTTSFGSYCSATGGGGSNSYSSHSGGYGGTGSGGNVNLLGGGGCGHVNSVGYWSGGRGGQSYFGGSAPFCRATATKIYNGSPGAGGPGGRTNENGTGGAGENGLVVVYTYK